MRHTNGLRRRPVGVRALQRHINRFAREDDGMMVFLVMFLLLIMLVVGGMGVDFMRQEMTRAQIQSTLDRAILAAADMDQELDPKSVVEDYFKKSGMENFLTKVEVDEGASYRIVTASASTEMSTQFLGKIGFKTLTVPAFGRAEESLGNAEISLVLDISNSMNEGSKIQDMRKAAKDFVDTVLLDETLGAVSLSVIPYTSQVNAGPEILNRLNVHRMHSYSDCIIFNDADYNNTSILPTTEYRQMPHFELYKSGSSSNITNPSCPNRNFEQIQPFSQNKQDVKNKVGSAVGRANTAINIGMKWGVGLVDPAFRPVVTDMINNGLVSADFKGRPTDYDAGSLKTVVLMTDGVNVDTYNVTDKAYATPSMRYHWSRNALITWLQEHSDSSLYNDFFYTVNSGSKKDSLLHNICEAAKNKGILVWTVGFEVNDHGASVMQDCASSPSHFFRVDGVEIAEAFRSIARQLNRLKLVQ